MARPSKFERDLRNLHGDGVVDWQTGRQGSPKGELPKLTIFGSIVLLPALIALGLLFLALAAGLLLFVYLMLLVFFGNVVGVIGAVLMGVILVGMCTGRLRLTR